MRLRDDVHPALTAEGGALLDERTGRWTHLTPTAAGALAALLDHDDRGRAIAAFAARYGIDTDRARADVRRVAADLTDRGLTAPVEPVRRRTRRWWR